MRVMVMKVMITGGWLGSNPTSPIHTDRTKART